MVTYMNTRGVTKSRYPCVAHIFLKTRLTIFPKTD